MKAYRGYYTNAGYFGWVGNRYMMFDTISEYYAYMDEIYAEEKTKCALENLLAQLPWTYQGTRYQSH